MALKKTIQGSTNSPTLWSFKTVATETSTDVSSMESIVEVEPFLGRISSKSYFQGNYNLKYEVDGQEYEEENIYKSSGDIAAGSYVSLGKHQFTIKHATEPTTIDIKVTMTSSDFSPSSASAEGSMTLTELHYPPTLEDITFVEQNSLLVEAGVGDNYFVPFLSNKKVTITADTYDSATMAEYKIFNDQNIFTSTTNEIIMDFTNKTLYTLYHETLARNIANLKIQLKDSLNSISTFVYDGTYIIPYVKPNLILTSSNVKRNGQLSGKVNLNLLGTFYNASVGSTENKITLSFAYWKVGATESNTYYEIPEDAYIIDGNNITIDNWNIAKSGTTITDVNKDSSYKFKIKAVDSFGSQSIIELNCPRGEYLMAEFKDRVDFKAITKQNEQVYVNKFSTNEMVVGTWKNGKPIYRKVIDFGALNSEKGTKTIAHNITDLEQITDIKIIGYSSDYAFPIPFVGTAYMFSSVDYAARVDKTNIYIYVSGDSSSQTAVVTLEYTKTTE